MHSVKRSALDMAAFYGKRGGRRPNFEGPAAHGGLAFHFRAKKDELWVGKGYLKFVLRIEMSIAEATALLDARLQRYRTSSYEQLLPLLNHPSYAEGIAPSGAAFRMEVSVFWEKYPYGNLRVFGLLDAFYDNAADSPVTQTFLVEPEG